jgi:hypothetical protein
MGKPINWRGGHRRRLEGMSKAKAAEAERAAQDAKKPTQAEQPRKRPIAITRKVGSLTLNWRRLATTVAKLAIMNGLKDLS